MPCPMTFTDIPQCTCPEDLDPTSPWCDFHTAEMERRDPFGDASIMVNGMYYCSHGMKLKDSTCGLCRMAWQALTEDQRAEALAGRVVIAQSVSSDSATLNSE